MITGKKQFLAGSLAGLLLMALTFDGRTLVAAGSQTLTLAQMPPEIRQGYGLGLLPPKAFTATGWKEEITSQDFRLAVQKILQQAGSPIAGRLADLVQAGILSHQPNQAIVLRREAFETVFRMVIHLWNEGILAPPSPSSGRRRFSDYTPRRAYRPALAWLLEHEVIRGYEDGRLRVRRPLTNRDCLYLLVRLHEQVMANRLAADRDQVDRGHAFLDLSTESWLTEPIQCLEAAGAFSFTRLGPRLDGDRPMGLADTAGLVSGILTRADRPAPLAAVQQVVGEGPAVRSTTRGQLARLTAALVDAFVEPPPLEEFPYTDVRPDSPTGRAVRRLAAIGLRMGYPTGRLAPDEAVTRYEIIGTLHAALRLIGPVPPAPAPTAAPAEEAAATAPPPADPVPPSTAADLVADEPLFPSTEDFARLIRAKQQKIRTLLERNPIGQPRFAD